MCWSVVVGVANQTLRAYTPPLPLELSFEMFPRTCAVTRPCVLYKNVESIYLLFLNSPILLIYLIYKYISLLLYFRFEYIFLNQCQYNVLPGVKT